MQKIILVACLSLLIVGVAGYGIFIFSPILKRPSVIINYPSEGETVSGTEIIVKGQVKNVSRLYLNGSQLTISKNGGFESRLAIWEGHTILVITGYDRFGRSVSVSRIIGTK